MFHLERPAPLGLRSRNWIWYFLFAAGLLRLSSLADAPLSSALQRLPEPLRGFFFRITDLGDSSWILIPALALWAISALLATVGRKRIPRLALIEMCQLYAFVFIGVGLPSLVGNLVKRLVGRARPDLIASPGPIDYRHFSNDWHYEGFPSGHATTIVALAFVVGFLTPRWFWPMLAVAVLVCVSRIVVGLHYPTDVLGGAMLGALLAYAVRNAFAARGWAFVVRPDGTIIRRPFAAVERLARKRPAPAQRAAL